MTSVYFIAIIEFYRFDTYLDEIAYLHVHFCILLSKYPLKQRIFEKKRIIYKKNRISPI